MGFTIKSGGAYLQVDDLRPARDAQDVVVLTVGHYQHDPDGQPIALSPSQLAGLVRHLRALEADAGGPAVPEPDEM